MKTGKRIACVVAIVAALATTTGCFGSFGLVKKVYGFNEQVSPNKWGRWGVFMLLNIPFVPVYSIAAGLDAIFFNSVEFWMGESLIADSSTNKNRREAEQSYEDPAAVAPAKPAPARPKSKKTPTRK